MGRVIYISALLSIMSSLVLGQGYVSYDTYVYTANNPTPTPSPTNPTPAPVYQPVYSYGTSSYYADPYGGYYGSVYYYTGPTSTPTPAPTPTPTPTPTDAFTIYYSGYHGDRYTGYYAGYYGAYTYYGPSIYDNYEGYVGNSFDYRSMFRYKYNRTTSYSSPYNTCEDDFDCSSMDECCAFNEKENSDDVSDSFCRDISDVKDLDEKGEAIGIRAKCKFRYRLMIIVLVCITVPLITLLILFISCCYCQQCPLYKTCRKDKSGQIHQQVPNSDTQTPHGKKDEDDTMKQGLGDQDKTKDLGAHNSVQPMNQTNLDNKGSPDPNNTLLPETKGK